MRDIDDQRYALECLKLAVATAGHAGSKAAVRRAEAYLAFVLGTDADDAKAKLAVACTQMAAEGLIPPNDPAQSH